jgi:NtrC-family two-component system sensor histidine kinase KinB
MRGALQLKSRLAIAGALLIAATVITGFWSVTSFRRVSRVVGRTVTENARITDATATLAGTLEREDDALLLVLSEQERGKSELARQQAAVAAALVHVLDDLESPDVAVHLRADVDAYQGAVNGLVADAQTPDARTRYHEQINPLLRRAVASSNAIRDEHFRSSQTVAGWAAGQATRSMQIVAMISLVALVLLVLIVVHLAQVVMRPIGEMTRAVQAIRQGDFSQRITTRRDDELGRLGAGLNQMADELEEFRRTNIGEVIHAKETLEATLEAFPDAVLVIGDDRRISEANPRAIETLGSVRGQALGALPMPEPTRAAVEEVLRSGDAHEATVDLAKTVELAVHGRTRRLLPRIVPIGDGRGAVLVLSDVTDLARLDEMRLELVAVASHELRTPLTTMRMTLSMLQERTASYEPRDRDLVATAMVGVEQLSVLVDEFLDLTRIEAGQLRLQVTRLHLRNLVERSAASIAPAFEQARVTLEVEHGTSMPPSIMADEARLAMVVSNLLSNAVKYTPSGGRVVLRTTSTDDSISIEVGDSGPGIAPEYRERVFDRFFRVEHAGEAALPAAGAGIGLYIARQVIEAHGGTIRCDGSPLGGARFVVTVPITPARP